MNAFRRRRAAFMLMLLATFVATVGGAFGFWSGSGTSDARFAGDSVGPGEVAGVVAVGSSVTVRWARAELLSGVGVSGYVIQRRGPDGSSADVGPGCSGVVTALTCTEDGVPDGTWRYSVTPVIGLWRGAESSGVTVTVGATAIVFVTPPRTFSAGGHSEAITVQRRDANGVPTVVGDQSIALSSNSSSASLPSSVVIPDGASSVAFTYRDVRSGGATVTAQGDSLAEASQPVTVTPGAPWALAFMTPPPGHVVAGEVIEPAIGISLLDRYGNITGSDASVSLVITGPGPTSLAGTRSVAATDGTAAFNAISIEQAGTYTLTATSDAVPSIRSTPFVVDASEPARLRFSTSPVDAVAGTSIGAPAVEAVDRFGNPVPSDAVVSVGLSIPGRATLSGSLSAQMIAGATRWDGLTVDRIGTYTLTAVGPDGLVPAVSPPFAISPAAAHHLAFGTQPVNTVAGHAFTVTGEVRDVFDNVVTTPTDLTVVLSPTGCASPLIGAHTVSTVGGVAVFSDLSLNRAGDGCTLLLTGPVMVATSTPFSVSADVAAKLAFTVQPGGGVAGAPMQAVVQVLDAFDNPVPTVAPIAVALGTNPAAGSLSGGSAVASVSGVASFDGLTVDRAGAGYTLVASGSMGSVVSAPFTIVPGPAARMSFTVPPGSVAAGSTIAPAVVVRVEDQWGNVGATPANLPPSNVTLALSGSGGGSLSGSLSAPMVNGLATFPGLQIDRMGTYSLVAGATGLTSAVSPTFTVTAPVRGALQLVDCRSGGVYIPCSTALPLKGNSLLTFGVEVLDARGLPAAGSVSVTVVSGDPSRVTVSGSPGSTGAVQPQNRTTSFTLQRAGDKGGGNSASGGRSDDKGGDKEDDKDDEKGGGNDTLITVRAPGAADLVITVQR